MHTNTVYIFAYFTSYAYILHITAYNMHISAYFCRIHNPFQLAGLLAVPVPFQQALQQQVHVHSSLLTSSCRFTLVWLPVGASQACPPPGTPNSSGSPLCLSCHSISLAPAEGQSSNIGTIYIYITIYATYR